MTFTCVYVKTIKKFQKFVKVNKIRNKYILDVKKMMDEENVDPSGDKIYLKILILNKVQLAIEKNKDVYFIPNFDDEFSIEKLLNLKKILEKNNFNILVFEDEFEKNPGVIDEAYEYLSYFDHSQILNTY